MRAVSGKNYNSGDYFDVDYIEQDVKDGVEAAITVYLESNFDLGDD